MSRGVLFKAVEMRRRMEIESAGICGVGAGAAGGCPALVPEVGWQGQARQPLKELESGVFKPHAGEGDGRAGTSRTSS